MKAPTPPGDGRERGSVERRSAVSFTASSLVYMAASMVSNLVVIRWLAPAEAGIWQTLVMVQSWFSFVQLGFFNGLNHELPFRWGRGERDLALRMASVTFGWSLLCATLAPIAFGVALLFYADEPQWALGLGAAGMATAFTFYREYLGVTFRTAEAFHDLAWINVVQAVLAVATVPLVVAGAFDGLCLRMAVLGAAAAALLHWKRPHRLRPAWDLDVAKRLVAVGAPFVAIGFLASFANGLDRVILLGTGGVTAVGLFTPALALKAGATFLPGALNQLLLPRLEFRRGQAGDPHALWRTSSKAVAVSTLLMLPVVLLGWFLLPPLVRFAFPQYEAGIDAARVVLLGTLLSGLEAGTAVLSATRSYVRLASLQVAAVVLLGGLPWLFTFAFADPLVAVATGFLVARLLLFPLGLGLMYRATHPRVDGHPASGLTGPVI